MTYLSIILPIYNEEKRLERCLDHLTAYLFNYTHWRFEILCVLNGCTDRSEMIVQRYRNLWPQLRQVKLTEAGKGLAVKAGMLRANGLYRMMMDVDLATPPTEIPKFMQAIESSDIVIGRRPDTYTEPIRRAAHLAYKQFTAPFTSVKDPQSGFKMFRERAAGDIFSQVKIKGWGFDVESLYLAHQMKYSVCEIPVRWMHEATASKLNPVKDGLQMLGELMKIRKLHAA